MKKQTHPVSEATVYTCGNCGTQIKTVSTKKSGGTLDSCSNCHSAYTEETVKKRSTGGRVELFNNRYSSK